MATGTISHISKTHTHTRRGPPVGLGMRYAGTAMRMLRAQQADLEVEPQNVNGLGTSA